MASPSSSAVVVALENAWRDIQVRHPQTPDVVVALASGSEGRSLRLGHYASQRWETSKSRFPEMFVSGEGLQRGPRDVLGTLLHEAAHGIAEVRGIADTSRNGRYHNGRYRALAGELGLDCAHSGSNGWSDTGVGDSLALTYAQTIRHLSGAIKIRRQNESAAGSKHPDNNLKPAICGCNRRIRVSRSTLASGDIVCGLCGAKFSPA